MKGCREVTLNQNILRIIKKAMVVWETCMKRSKSNEESTGLRTYLVTTGQRQEDMKDNFEFQARMSDNKKHKRIKRKQEESSEDELMA